MPVRVAVKGVQVWELNIKLREAWRDAGMPGKITFGLIRASVTSHVMDLFSG